MPERQSHLLWALASGCEWFWEESEKNQCTQWEECFRRDIGERIEGDPVKQHPP